MKTLNKTAKIVLAAALTGAMAAPAGVAFAGDKTERAVIGALLGGVAGVAVAKNDTQGALIGAAAGAVLGAATAKNKRTDRYAHQRRYNDRYATAYGYRNNYDRYAYDRAAYRYR